MLAYCQLLQENTEPQLLISAPKPSPLADTAGEPRTETLMNECPNTYKKCYVHVQAFKPSNNLNLNLSMKIDQVELQMSLNGFAELLGPTY